MLKLNGKEVKPTIFPDKTSQVWKLDTILDNNVIEWRYETEAEFIHLAQLVTLLKKKGRGTIELWMPYLPYARQDKFIHNNECFALRTFANLLNQLELNRISSFDAHSAVAGRVIKNFHSVSADALIGQIVKDYDVIIYPDAGAVTRYTNHGKPYDCGNKVRDQLTGRITHYELTQGGFPAGTRALVIDDICDGGATFVLLGQELEKRGIKASLYVSHGIFSKGTGELRKYYKEIMTTDSLPQGGFETIVFVTPRD